MNTTRIAFISEHASPLAAIGNVDSGGQNVYVAELCKQLAAAGYYIDIFTRKDNIAQPETQMLCRNARVVHIKAGPETFVEKEKLLPYMQEFANNMHNFMKCNRITYDLMHANFFMSGLVASILKARTGIPYTITFHALGLVRKVHQKEADRFPEERISIESILVQDADSIIAECPEDRCDLITHYDAPAEKISIIPCGFSHEEFSPVDKETAREKLRLEKDEKIVLQLGRMVPRKGIDNVIQALALLPDDKVKLLVVGGEQSETDKTINPELQRLTDVARSNGVTDRVIFTGRKDRSELKYYYAAADIFITTPWYEPFGITPLEAMACGTPVIGSDVGGIKYSVKNGITGFLIPPKNPAALSEKIIEILNNPALQKKMSKECISRVNKLFTWKKVAQSVCLLYTSMIKQKSGTQPVLALVPSYDNKFKNNSIASLPAQYKTVVNE